MFRSVGSRPFYQCDGHFEFSCCEKDIMGWPGGDDVHVVGVNLVPKITITNQTGSKNTRA